MIVWVISEHSYSAETEMWYDCPIMVFSTFEKAQTWLFETDESEEYWNITPAIGFAGTDMIYEHTHEDGSISGYMIESYKVIDGDPKTE